MLIYSSEDLILYFYINKLRKAISSQIGKLIVWPFIFTPFYSCLGDLQRRVMRKNPFQDRVSWTSAPLRILWAELCHPMGHDAKVTEVSWLLKLLYFVLQPQDISGAELQCLVCRWGLGVQGEPSLAFLVTAWKLQSIDRVMLFFSNAFHFVGWTEWVSSSYVLFHSEASAYRFDQLLP